MSSSFLFWVIISIISVEYIVQYYIDAINAKHFNDELPKEVDDVFDDEEYLKSQAYKKAYHQFGKLSGAFSLVIILGLFFIDAFAFIDDWLRQNSSNEILISLGFFGVLFFANEVIQLPFSYYSTFVIEEKFGFNKTTLKTFIFDKIKSWFLAIVVGGGVLALLQWFYLTYPSNFWWYAWLFIIAFSLLINLFYAQLIVPLFNKQTPLQDGKLKDKIEAYAQQVQFQIQNIFVIDGSKRSTKANAYFSGFGKQKRITLYDTLINDLSEDEVVAVLAHEVGHYKHKHIIYNLVLSSLLTGLTLYLLSLTLNEPIFSEAINVSEPSFHIGLLVFGFLYGPVSTITGIVMNLLSRKFEYQADNYAQKTHESKHLINALKKLNKKSLSNLTPHPYNVFINYSHPPLKDRIKNLLS